MVEGAKAAIEYSPISGFSVNDNPTEVAKETTKNTAISVTVGKILDASSSHTVETTTKEASDAAKKVSSANHKVNHNPSSQKAAEALNKAEERASAAGAQAAGTKALNYTIGANPEATKTGSVPSNVSGVASATKRTPGTWAEKKPGEGAPSSGLSLKIQRINLF